MPVCVKIKLIFFFRDCRVCSRIYTSACGDDDHGEGLVRRQAAMESLEGKWLLRFVFDPHMLLHPLLLASCALHHLCTQDHNQLSNARFPTPPPQGSRYVVALPCAIRPCSELSSWCVVRHSASFLQCMRAFWFHICFFINLLH